MRSRLVFFFAHSDFFFFYQKNLLFSFFVNSDFFIISFPDERV